MYQMNVHGKRITVQTVGDGFDLMYDGSMFQVLWEQEKRKNAFTWQNKNKRHDPFAVHEFGDKVNQVVAPTTRERGTAAAMNIQVLDRERQQREERKQWTSPRWGGSSSNPERKRAIAELEKEREQTYNDLKAAIGKTEADQQIKTYMTGTYKKRMEEIDRAYPKNAPASRAASGSNKKEKKEKKRREERKQEEPANALNFDTGFDHGFENMATFNGRSVGKE